MIDDELQVPVKKRKWLRGIGIAFVAVFLFELLVEPMVRNEDLSAWSDLYRDVSILSS